MKNDVFIKNGFTIQEHELKITTSKAGGPGGQHVNKTDTKITIHWNVKNTQFVSEEKRAYLLMRLSGKLNQEGELVVWDNSSRSQQQNKKNALLKLAQIVRKALIVPKKRIATKMPESINKARLLNKSKRSKLKQARRITWKDD